MSETQPPTTSTDIPGEVKILFGWMLLAVGLLLLAATPFMQTSVPTYDGSAVTNISLQGQRQMVFSFGAVIWFTGLLMIIGGGIQREVFRLRSPTPK